MVKMSRYKPVGWRNDSYRHSLAAKGIRTSFAIPSVKSPSMEKFLDDMSEKTYGRKRTESIKKDICVECGGPAKDFKSGVSKREFPISGLCQKCQDKVFNKNESMAGKQHKLSSRLSSDDVGVVWVGKVPEVDDFDSSIRDEFIDGRTKMGPWAIMSPATFEIEGVGIGPGSGQRYKKQGDNWVKVE